MESSSNIKAKDDLQQRQHAQSLSGPTLKHVDSFIQIDSISIDLPTVNSKNEKTPKCEHFSIRKYVSDMRQKDIKACWPFECNVKSDPAELERKFSLPPIDIPKFCWWKCRNCLQGICQTENGKAVPLNDSSGEYNSDVGLACSHIALTGSETMVLVSDFKQILKLENSADKGEPVADNANESNALSCGDKKDRRDSSGCKAVAQGTGLEDNVGLESRRPSPCAAEPEKGDAANGALGLPKNIQLQRHASQDCRLEAKGINSPQTLPATVEEVDLGTDSHLVHQNGFASDDSNCQSSDSAEVGPGYRSRDKPGASRRRKFRKMRLLSDLLGQKGSMNIDIRREESPLPAISDASEKCGVKKFSWRRKLKKKFSEDDFKENVSDKGANEVEIVEGDAEENTKALGDDAVAKISPRSILKPEWTKHLEDVDSGLVKRKTKKTNEVKSLQNGFIKAIVSEMGNNSYSLVDPLQMLSGDSTNNRKKSLKFVTKKKKRKLAQESLEDTIDESRRKAAVDVSVKSHGHDALMSGETGSLFSSALEVDKNSCMCAKKSKMTPRGGDHYTAQIPQDSSSKFSKDSMRGVNFGLVQSGPATIQFLGDSNAAMQLGNGLPSVDGKAEAERALSFNYEMASTIPWHQVVPEEAQGHEKNNTYLEQNLAASKLDNSFKKAIHHKGAGKEPIASIPYTKEKQSHTSQFGNVGQLPMLQKGISGANKKGEITGSRDKSAAKKPSNKSSKESSARGTSSDDIPMEIVELMAKIQYENALHDTVKDQTQVDSRKTPSYHRFGGDYSNGEPNLSHPDCSMSNQNQLKDVIKQGNAKQKAATISHSPDLYKHGQFMTQVEQKLTQNHFKGHGVLYPHYPEKLSMHKRNEEAMFNNYKSSAAFESLSPCSTRHVAGSAEPFNFWSSSIVPTGLVPAPNNAPRDFIPPSAGMKSLGLQVGNKYEIPGVASGKNSYATRTKGLKVQSSLPSSDVYSNENISAMHLLSLMDPRHEQNVKGNSRLGKQPSSVQRSYPPKELNFGAYRASEISRPSSDYHQTINFVAPRKYDQCLSSVPLAGSSSLFDPHESLRNRVMGQVPLKVREKGKTKCSDLIGSIGGSGSKNPVSSGHIPLYNQQTIELARTPNSVVLPSKIHNVHMTENELFRSSISSVWPPRYTLETGICTVNRNPAEFSVPESGNVYTIRGKELKLTKRLQEPKWSVSPVIDLNRPKRGRNKKIVTANLQQPEHPLVL